MTTETTYKNLPIPDEGQEDWDDELHETFDIIDASLKGVDENTIEKTSGTFDGLDVTSSASLNDNVPVSFGTDDDLTIKHDGSDSTTYFTDTNSNETLFGFPHDGTDIITTDRRIQHSSNGDYLTDAEINGDITPTSVTAQSTNEVRNAKAFDGADGGAMIQAAIDALPSSGGTVWVPPTGPDTNGRWTVSEHILLRSNVRLISYGATLYLADGSDDNIIMTNETENDAVVSNIVIEGFTMDGNRSNNDRWARPSDGLLVNPACVFVLRTNVIRIRDCEFRSSRGYGVKLARTTNGTVESCVAYDMQDDGFTAADVRYSVADTRYCTFYNCYAENNDNTGFEVDDGPQHITIANCVANSNVKGFHVHTHDFTDTPASPQNIYHYNCVAINNDNGFMNGSHILDDQASGMYYYNIYASGSTDAAFTAGASNNNDDIPATDLIVDGFKFDHPESANSPAIYLNSGTIVSDWTFSNGVVRTGRRGLSGAQAVDGLTLSNVDFDVSDMTAGESGVELNAGSGGTVRNITIDNCSVHGAINSGLQMWSGGGTLEKVQIKGGNYYNNGQNNSNAPGSSGISINDNGGTPTEISVNGAHCYDDQSTKTQENGIWWDSVTNSSFVGNVLVGNVTSATDGTLDTSSVTAGNVPPQ